MRVAVIGLGAMGMGAARSCLRAGLATAGCDLRPEARAAFTADGGTAWASPDAIEQGTEAVLLLVVNAAQTEAALFGPQGCAQRLAPGAVVISSATMSPDDARRLAAEAMSLGIRAGADPRQLYDVVTSAAGNSWMFENRMARVLEGDDARRAEGARPVQSAVDIFVKDLGLVAEMARGLQHPVPLASQAQQLFTAASAMGHGRADDGFVIRVWQALTGIALPGEGGGA